MSVLAQINTFPLFQLMMCPLRQFFFCFIIRAKKKLVFAKHQPNLCLQNQGILFIKIVQFLIKDQSQNDMVYMKMAGDGSIILDKLAAGKKVFDKYFDAVFKVFVPIYKYGFVPSVILYGMFFTEPKPHYMQVLMPTM
eukprot:TRINITY_DN250_c0_g1_i6.p2 TRINITY_DN250_c0_g1~~TRINITY_DN250_c0_g1_i6.p2  ORF type:complete len:138 (+),score=7.40 TRINITY_DN250_c0_g1_i6:826-1239(+)